MTQRTNATNATESMNVKHSLTFRTVPARAGWTWVYQGFRLLMANPAPIHLGLMFLFAGLVLSSSVPIVGFVLPALLMPVLYVGLMNVIAASHAAAAPSQVNEGSPHHKRRAFMAMLTVFQDRQGVLRLMTLGGIYAFAVLAMMGLTTLFDDGFMFNHLVLGDALPNTNEAKQQMLNGMFWVLPMYAPVSLIFWFAPQLVGVHGHGIVKALFFSGLGCWRNLSAFAVYAATWVGVFIGVNLCLALLIGWVGSTAGTFLAMVVSVFLVTCLYCSFYASYLSLVQVTPSDDEVA